MTAKHWRIGSAAIAIFATSCIAVQAQAGDPGTIVREKLTSQIKLTKADATHDDIVTPGDVVVLHKDGLMMCSSASSYAYSNSYNNGVLAGNDKNRAKDAARSVLLGKIPFGGDGGTAGAASNACASRKFVAGEKFWVTGVALAKDGIVIDTFSDPYNDVRYYGEIKFPFPKGAPVPSADSFLGSVSEVMTVVPPDDNRSDAAPAAAAPAADIPPPPPKPVGIPGAGGGNNGGRETPGTDGGTAGFTAVAPEQPTAAIAPPPPPADATPPTIEIGQTKDQVVAAFGQPLRTAKLAGTKEIYVYKDMKITFVAGKVSSVE